MVVEDYLFSIFIVQYLLFNMYIFLYSYISEKRVDDIVQGRCESLLRN